MNSSSGEKAKILMVEDEPRIAQICRRTLKPEGYQVDIATNGVFAQEMLMKEDYDLIIIDIRTPVMNGKQLYQYINKRCPKLADRVIFTTGDVVSNDIQQFLEKGGRPFLPKPFTPDELKTIVRDTLRQVEK